MRKQKAPQKHNIDYYEIEKYNPEMFPFVAMTIGRSLEQAHIDRPDGFELHQFIWVTAGEGIFKVNGQTFSLTKGQGVFTRRECSVSYYSAGETFSTSWVTFLSGEKLLKYYNTTPWFRFDVPDFLEESSAQLASLCSTTPSLASRSALGYMWATELLDTLFQHPLSRSEKVKQFLEQNYDKPLTLEEIAEQNDVDKFTLCKQYLRDTGETVMKTLKSIRLQRAKRLLRYGFDSVEEIGHRCGYDSVSYFIKNFREEMGCTPLQYRQSKQKKKQ